MALIGTISQILIGLLLLATPLGFIGGIVLIVMAFDAKDKAKRRNRIIYSIVTFFGTTVLLFVVLSLWGLAKILTNSTT